MRILSFAAIAICLGVVVSDFGQRPESLDLKGLTSGEVIARLGSPSSVGDGLSMDKGALVYDTMAGRLVVFFETDGRAVFSYPGDFQLQNGKLPRSR